AGEYFHHSGIKPLLVCIQRVPCWKAFRTSRELSVLWHYAELLLPLECLFAILVPTLVEFSLEFGDPFFRSVMWSMSSTGRDIKEIRFIGRNTLGLAHPGDCFVGKIGGEVIFRVRRSGHKVPILIENRVPMVHIAAVEAVEIIKPQSVGP